MAERPPPDFLGWVSAILAAVGVVSTLVAVQPEVLNRNASVYVHQLVPALPWIAIGAFGTAMAFGALRYRGLVDRVSGIRATFTTRDNPRYKAMQARSFAKGRKIRVMGISNLQLTQDRGEEFFRRLVQENGHLRILFLDPDCQATTEREKMENLKPGAIRGTTEYSIGLLRNALKQLSMDHADLRRHIEAKRYSYFAGLNVIMIDEDEAYIQHYGASAQGVQSPAFVLRGRKKGWLAFFDRQFKDVWDNAADVELA